MSGSNSPALSALSNSNSNASSLKDTKYSSQEEKEQINTLQNDIRFVSLELSLIVKEVSEIKEDLKWIKKNLYVNKSCKFNTNGNRKAKASVTGISGPTGANDVNTKGNKGSYASNTGTNEAWSKFANAEDGGEKVYGNASFNDMPEEIRRIMFNMNRNKAKQESKINKHLRRKVNMVKGRREGALMSRIMSATAISDEAKHQLKAMCMWDESRNKREMDDCDIPRYSFEWFSKVSHVAEVGDRFFDDDEWWACNNAGVWTISKTGERKPIPYRGHPLSRGANDVTTQGNKGSYASNTGTNEKAGHLKVRNNKTGEEIDIDVFAKEGEQAKEAMLRVKHDWAHKEDWMVLTNMVEPADPDTAEQGPENFDDMSYVEQASEVANELLAGPEVGDDAYGMKDNPEEVMMMDAEQMANRVANEDPTAKELLDAAKELVTADANAKVTMPHSTTIGPGNSVESILVPMSEQTIEDEVGSNHDAAIWNILNMDASVEEKQQLAADADKVAADAFKGLGTRTGDIAAEALYLRPTALPGYYDWEPNPQPNTSSGSFERFEKNEEGNWVRIPTDSNGNDIEAEVVEEKDELAEAVDAIIEEQEVPEVVEREVVGQSSAIADEIDIAPPIDFDYNNPTQDDYIKIRNAAANKLMLQKGDSSIFRPLTCLMLTCCNAIEKTDQDYDVQINVALRDVARRIGKPGWRNLSNNFTNKVYGMPGMSDAPSDSTIFTRKDGELIKVNISAPGKPDFGVSTDEGASIQELLNRISKTQEIPPTHLSQCRLVREGTPLFDRGQTIGGFDNAQLELRPIVAGGSRPLTLFVKGGMKRSIPIQHRVESVDSLFYQLKEELGIAGDFYIRTGGHNIYKEDKRPLDWFNLKNEQDIEVRYRLRGGADDGDVNTGEVDLSGAGAAVADIASKSSVSAKVTKQLEGVGMKGDINNIGQNSLMEINNQEDTYGYKTNIGEGLKLSVSQELRANGINAAQAIRNEMSVQGPNRFQELDATGIGGQISIIKTAALGDASSAVSTVVKTLNEGVYLREAANSNDKARRGRETTPAGAQASFRQAVMRQQNDLPGSDLYQISRDNTMKLAGNLAWHFFSANRGRVDNHFTGIQPIKRLLGWEVDCVSKSSGDDFQPGLVAPNNDGQTYWKGIFGAKSFPADKPICPSGMPRPMIGNFSGVPDQEANPVNTYNWTPEPRTRTHYSQRDVFFAAAEDKNCVPMMYAMDESGNDIDTEIAANWLAIPDPRLQPDDDIPDAAGPIMQETYLCTSTEWAAAEDPDSGVTYREGLDPNVDDDVLYLPVNNEMDCIGGGSNHHCLAFIAAHLPEISQRVYPTQCPDIEGNTTYTAEVINSNLDRNLGSGLWGERDSSGISFLRKTINTVQTGIRAWKKIVLVLPDKHVTWGPDTVGGVSGINFGRNNPKTFNLRAKVRNATWAGYQTGTPVGTNALRNNARGYKGGPVYENGEVWMRLSTDRHNPFNIDKVVRQNPTFVNDGLIEAQSDNDYMTYLLTHWWSQDGNALLKDLTRARRIAIDKYRPSAKELDEAFALLTEQYAGKRAPANQGGVETLANTQNEVGGQLPYYDDSDDEIQDAANSYYAGGVPVRHNDYYSVKNADVPDYAPNTAQSRRDGAQWAAANNDEENRAGKGWRHLNTPPSMPGAAQLGTRPEARILARVPGPRGTFMDKPNSALQLDDHASYGFALQTTQWAQNSTLTTMTGRCGVNVGLINSFLGASYKGGVKRDNRSGIPVSMQSYEGMWGPNKVMKQGTDYNVPSFNMWNAVYLYHNMITYGTTVVSGDDVRGADDSTPNADEMKRVAWIRNIEPNNLAWKIRTDNNAGFLACDQHFVDKGNPSVSKICSGPLIPEHQNWIGIPEDHSPAGTTKGGVFFPFNQDANPNEDFRAGLISKLRQPIVEEVNPGNNKGSAYRWTTKPPPNRYNPGFLTINHPDIGVKCEMQCIWEHADVVNQQFGVNAPGWVGAITKRFADLFVGPICVEHLNVAAGTETLVRPNYGFSCPTVMNGHAWNLNRLSQLTPGSFARFGSAFGDLTTGINSFVDVLAIGGIDFPIANTQCNWYTNNQLKLWNTQGQSPFNILPFGRLAPVLRQIKAGTPMTDVTITNENTESTIEGTGAINMKVDLFRTEGKEGPGPDHYHENDAIKVRSTTFRSKNTPTVGTKVESNLKQLMFAAGSNGVAAPTLVQQGLVPIGTVNGVPDSRSTMGIGMAECNMHPITLLTVGKTRFPNVHTDAHEYFNQPNRSEITLNNRGENVEMPMSAFSLSQALRTPYLPANNHLLKRLSTAEPTTLGILSYGGGNGDTPNRDFLSLVRAVASDAQLNEFIMPTVADTSQQGVTRNIPNREGCDVMLVSGISTGLAELAQRKKEVMGTPQVYVGGDTPAQLDFTYDAAAVTDQEVLDDFGLGSASSGD